MQRLKILAAILAVPLLLPAVASAQQVDTGSANFTQYVAIGDSMTAGFMSGGLVETAQQFSYPALIYRQATGRSTGFEQPLITVPGIPALLELRSLSPLVIAPRAGQGSPRNLNLQRPYNNLAVPGADVHDVVATVSDNGGLHDLILRRLGTQVQQAVALQPTFLTIWVGNNDALGAALAGRVIDDVTLTTVAKFEADYRAMISALASTGAKMAIANIPDVTSIPYVTTIPRVVVNPATQQPVLVNGQPVPLIGPNGLLGPNDRVLLTASTELAQGKGIPVQLGGTGAPLSDAVVLDAGEVAAINGRVAAFNSIIASVANQTGAAFVDANALLRRIADQGISIGGIHYSETFLTGGIFSYDAVHPTALGYAYIANVFLEAINEKFGGDIPPVDLYPFVFGFESNPLPLASAADGIQTDQPEGILTASAVRNLFWALDVKTKAAKKKRPGRRK